MSDALNDTAVTDAAATDIAVVGMAGRFPGASSVAALWDNLCAGVESITFFTDVELRAAGVDRATLRNPNYVKSGAILPDMEMFDASFFGFSPRDAAIMDPQHRHFLECTWEALESAGHTVERFAGTIGVFAGSGPHTYLVHNLMSNSDLMQSVGMFLIRHTGNDKDFLTTRASYLLNLTGPSINVQTACSTSLVAIHMASQSLLSGECDLAMAGGVTIEVPHRQGYLYQEGEILSSDGHCRAFDAKSQGTIFGSGVGVVVLRRLADAIADGDTIHAVIKGSAVNNDGSLKAGYLAPSVEGQARAISEALAISGVEADSITYVEAHGSGTPVGDPIEVAALTQAFRGHTDATGFCGIGSLKTNIGHLDTAAGVAAFIKTVKALESGVLPASLNFEAPNPGIDFEGSPFFVNAERTPWAPSGFPRRAGVNSLGVGGTNAFVILEQPPALAPTSIPARPAQLLALSARTEAALDAATERLAHALRQRPDLNLADVAYTLQVGRKAFPHRRVVACHDVEDAADALERRDPKRAATHLRGQAEPSIVFMFPGGGAQYPNMGRELYETEPRYREVVDSCLEAVRTHVDGDLRSLMLPPEGSDLEAVARELERPSLALPALFITEYALARLWMSWGIQPAAMTGHSMGEYTAACLAGVMSVEDALSLVALRGMLFETLPEGAMLSVRCSGERLRPLLGDELDLAAINGPELCLASGPTDAIDRLEARLTAQEIEHSRLKITVAAHSRMLAPILEEFGRRVATFSLRAPSRPWVSNLTGTWITAEEATDPDYWVRHLRQPVRFSDGVRTLLEEPNRLFLEVGPGQTLASLVKAHLSPKAAQHAAVTSTRHPRDPVSDVQFMLTSLGRLWLAGATPDWSALHAGERRRRIELPTYPFERQRHWIDPGRPLAAASAPADPLAKVSSLDDWFYRPTWKQVPPRLVDGASSPLRWLVFRDRLGLGDEIIRCLEQAGHQAIAVSAGETFGRLSETAYLINPDDRADYEALVADLVTRQAIPQRIVHLWSVVPESPARGGLDTFEASQALGFYSMLFLAQALGGEAVDEPLHIGIVTNRLQSVEGEPAVRPERATVLGPCKVIPREFPGVTCQSIDVEGPDGLPADPTLGIDVAAGRIVAELESPTDDQIVALRGDRRWVERFEAIAVGEPAADDTCRLREGGVYLITGGLGDIGLVQADYLARTARARLVLVGRTGLPDRDRWDDWLRAHAQNDPTSRRIRQVRELEALGAEVFVASADVTSLEQIRDVIRMARARFGALHGVIHAAGVLDDGVIQLKAPEVAARVLAPKVKGALVLDAALEGQELDFFILFSSTSSILGPTGQVDYVGANAFLDAFAQSRSTQGGTRTVAINWGIWQDVGMAARAAGVAGPDRAAPPAGERVGHPLLGVRTVSGPDRDVYVGRYGTADHWVLDEHRLLDGRALIPGTGYLEIARAAAHCSGMNGPIDLADVFFISPFSVTDGEARDLRVTVERDDATATITVEGSDNAAGLGWREHARAVVSGADDGARGRHCLDEIRGRCTVRQRIVDGDERTKQEQHVQFGPRWRVLRRIDIGTDEALAHLVLPSRFAADLDVFKAHPALLDMAAHVGLPLIEGYEQSNDFYVPFSCRRVRLHGELPAQIYSHARYRRRSAQTGLAIFDVCLMDAHGTVLVEIEEFALKRMPASALASVGRPDDAAPIREARAASRPSGDAAPDLLRLGLTEGILPAEGARALGRILAADAGSRVVASSIDLHALIAQIDASTRSSAGRGLDETAQDRPESAHAFVAPRNDVERTLATFWRELMGLDQVGIEDDFFDLGGYSLIAVRLFAKIKKAFGVDLSLDMLFQATTIAQCAAIIADELGIELDVTAPASEPATTNGTAAPTNGTARHGEHHRVVPVHGPEANGTKAATNGTKAATNGTTAAANGAAGARRASGWSPLVAIQPRGEKLPFFCVHGAGGNVLIFRDLSKRLGADQPFYGLQAQGVDGKLPPLERIEDMASQYLESIRTVQPNGPYLLGGYSGGGVVAFEMAQQLHQAGEEVALLAFLDTFNPGPAVRRDTNGSRLRKLVEQGPSYAMGRAKWLLDRQIDKVRWARVSYYTSLSLTVPVELREFQMFETFHRVQARYHPRAYPGSIVLLRAAEVAGAFAHVGPELGWEGLSERGIEVHEIPGTHNTLLLEPNVETLVTRLRASLTAAQEQATRAPIDQRSLIQSASGR
jgi:acyl transferase domain-containing protein/thioesterase domain-containing protein